MSDGDMDWEEGFYILRKSLCPAVLTENFFMDNRDDLEYIQSRAGKQAIVDTHVEGIIEYLNLK
jgi:N-acetylmuramoyl-L-alanine amidase